METARGTVEAHDPTRGNGCITGQFDPNCNTLDCTARCITFDPVECGA